MIDALFGSKTRVKLLHLFLNNPDKSFYVREITRIVEEQINSVRRELSNMTTIGIVSSDNSDHKLYYKVNQDYEHFAALQAIFSNKIYVARKNSKVDEPVIGEKEKGTKTIGKHGIDWKTLAKELPEARIVIAAGTLVSGSSAKIDLLIVSDSKVATLRQSVKSIEKNEGRELNFSILPYEEFYYRMSIRDKFITDILNNKHMVVVDAENVLKG